MSRTWGTRAMVVSSPTWPPLSVPSAMKPSTPRGARRRTRVVAGTTGKTLMPASFQAGIYWLGTPAPVVTTWTPSSTTTLAISAAAGFISMMFTPKGLLVRALHRRMCSRRVSAFMPPAPIRPRAPALDTAAANSPVAMLAMPPWIRGNSVPSSSFNFIFASPRLPRPLCKCACCKCGIPQSASLTAPFHKGAILPGKQRSGPGQAAAKAHGEHPHAGL